MGKIVKNANLVKEAYVVAVPERERELLPADNDFGDPFGDGDLLEFNGDGAHAAAIEAHFAEPAVDLERVRADARALIDAAEADAATILRDAASRAKELVERANARCSEIETQARAEGQRQGMEAGRAAGHAELEERIEEMLALIESARAERNGIIESAEPELVRLAMAIAERIVNDSIATDPKVVVENVRHALTRLVGRETVTVRVNPEDLETLRQHRDGIAGSNDVEHLRIVEDQRVDRGGVVIETDAGTIDAKVSTQLREVARALQLDEAAQAS